jgi:hypothetical protein
VQLNNNICFLFSKKKTICSFQGNDWLIMEAFGYDLPQVVLQKKLFLRPIFNTTIMLYFLLG